jgi:hypothetical protein
VYEKERACNTGSDLAHHLTAAPSSSEAFAGDDAGNAGGASLATSVFVQTRFLKRVLIGAQLGPEFMLPALRFVGSSGTVEWGNFRFNAGLRVGVLLGPTVPRSR